MPFVDQTGWLIKVGWSALINVIDRLLFEILQIRIVELLISPGMLSVGMGLEERVVTEWIFLGN
jgi:hypothetical protein